MKIKLNLLPFFFILCLTLNLAQAATVLTKITPTNIVQGESFRITYTIHERSAGANPDFSELENDFTILGSSNSMQMTIINGRSSVINTWNLTLLPKKSGRMTIPSIRFGKAYSRIIEINVEPATKVKLNHKNNKIFLRVSIDNRRPYVQSQVTYKIKLYFASNITRGNITPPQMNDVVLFALGNDKQYQEQYRNQLYNVLERNYVIFPQKSGTVTINPAVFTGIEQIPGRNPYSFTSKAVKVVGNKLWLSVNKIPSTMTDKTWLPAKNLSMREAWSDIPNQLKVGDPITRTIILNAEGLTSNQLPDIGDISIPGFNIYPDKAVTNDQVTNDSIIGQRKEKIAYIPTKAGVLTIPEVKVTWWNTKTNKMEIATLPKQTLTVQASTAQIAATPQNHPAKVAIDDASNKGAIANVNKAATIQQWLSLHYISVGLFFLWILTLGAWLYTRYKNRINQGLRKVDQHFKSQSPSLSRAKQAVKVACHNNKPQKAKAALLQWASLRWPSQTVLNLGQLADILEDEIVRQELSALDQLLYAKTETDWSGNGLWQAFDNASQRSKTRWIKTKSKADLPPLYPDNR